MSTVRGYDHWKTTEPDPHAFDEPPLVVITCPNCGGSGEIVFGVTSYEGGHRSTADDGRPCEACGGQGEIIEEAP